MAIRETVKSIPIIGPIGRRVYAIFVRRAEVPFSHSNQYWDDRYRAGGDSGAGSYKRLAHFKAKFLNSFVADRDVRDVIEFGSGDGAQLELAEYPSFVGVDVSRRIVEATREKFSDRADITILHTSEFDAVSMRADLTLSLDVIYHLVEDDVFETYMSNLFDASRKWVIIYASNMDEATNFAHVRHRKFTAWVDANRPEFSLCQKTDNPYKFDLNRPNKTSFADFYVFERT